MNCDPRREIPARKKTKNDIIINCLATLPPHLFSPAVKCRGDHFHQFLWIKNTIEKSFGLNIFLV